MAEISQEGGKKGGGKKRSKKMSTKIDFTPMVDLGFLLITFFMLTTVLSKPYFFSIAMPVDGPPNEVPEDGALTVILSGNNKIYYYYGTDYEQMKSTGFSKEGIRRILF